MSDRISTTSAWVSALWRDSGCASGTSGFRKTNMPDSSAHGIRCKSARLQHADEREIPILLHVIEPVADDKLIGDVETHVVCVEFLRTDFRFSQQHTDAHAQRIRLLVQSV